jgi:ComF family protein
VTALIPNPKSLIPYRDLIPNPQSLIPAIGNALVSAFLAPTCAVCSTVLDDPLSGCVCHTCWAAIRPITPPICDVCGDPLPRQSGRCAPCSATDHIISRSRSIGEYEGTLREVIHAFKYSGRQSLARPLATLMKARGAELLIAVDAVVPVPLHWRREYQRGFNQAAEISRHLGPPVVHALIRRRATRAQIELAAHQRHVNVEGAFAVKRRSLRKLRIAGRTILLVDDVCTTGATLNACARLLRDCGASAVYSLTAARVITRQSFPNP